jgi:glutamine amidotransferase
VRLAVIDYGGGNVGSLLAALERRSVRFTLASEPEAVRAADAAILPGDGAFAATMQALRRRSLDAAVRDVVARGRPFLGICVGMQLLFARSSEFSGSEGFGVIEGDVDRFHEAPRVPHMGWNRLERVGGHPFVEGLEDGAYVYFLHSYRAPVGPDTVAAATHGERFSAIVARENVMGTQFHPEKSQRVGGLLLDNFIRFAKDAS